MRPDPAARRTHLDSLRALAPKASSWRGTMRSRFRRASKVHFASSSHCPREAGLIARERCIMRFVTQELAC